MPKAEEIENFLLLAAKYKANEFEFLRDNLRMSKALQKIKDFGGCLCGHGEWCESCSSDSQFNHVRKIAREALKND